MTKKLIATKDNKVVNTSVMLDDNTVTDKINGAKVRP